MNNDPPPEGSIGRSLEGTADRLGSGPALGPHDRPAEFPCVHVGVGVIVMRDGLLLLGERRGSHGAGSWALPGGHLEFGETVEACARREVREETGLELTDIVQAPYTSDVFAQEQRHYVTLFVIAQAAAGEPRVMEPDKCAGWVWCTWADLHDARFQPLFAPLASLRDSGFVPAGLGDSPEG